MHPKGSFPHRFKVGQVVYWGNGREEYVRIAGKEPLHCEGGCPAYTVVNPRMGSYSAVSEPVLRPLTMVETGIEMNLSGSKLIWTMERL